MKTNSVENYKAENNLEEPSKVIKLEQESTEETGAEELKSDFSEIEKDYLDIIENPEASQSEKVKASVWMTRGKSMLYQGLALLSLSAPLKSAGQIDSSSFNNQLQHEVSKGLSDQEKNSIELEKYNEYGVLMAYNLASEKPTVYQAEQIKKLQDDIIAEINGRQFASMTEMIACINIAISSDFSEQESSIYIKDAFPEEPGAKAKGSYDCDTRLLITLSILNKLGITGDQAEFCLLEGHALLRIKDENVFFEMTSNSARELNPDESLQLNRINTMDKYRAYLLAKEGVALASEATGNIIKGESDNSIKIVGALNKMIAASEINPNDLTNNLNLLRLLKKTNHISTDDKSVINELVLKVSDNIKRGLLNNFYEINPDGKMDNTLILQIEEVNVGQSKPRRLEDLGSLDDLTVRALRENDFLSRKFINLGSDLLYDFKNPEAALPIFEALANAEENNAFKTKSTDLCFYKGMIANCLYDLKVYDEYLDLAQNELYDLLKINTNNETVSGSYFIGKLDEENLKIAAANVMAGKIIINEETVDHFCKEYKDDPLFGSFISGKQQWNSSAISAVEALSSWSGYESMIKAFDEHRKK